MEPTRIVNLRRTNPKCCATCKFRVAGADVGIVGDMTCLLDHSHIFDIDSENSIVCDSWRGYKAKRMSGTERAKRENVSAELTHDEDDDQDEDFTEETKERWARLYGLTRSELDHLLENDLLENDSAKRK